jgi:HlyD family secretion protein
MAPQPHLAEPPAAEARGSVMDIPRRKEGKRGRNLALASAALLVLVAGSTWLSRLKAAAPAVERASVWTDRVKRGEMLRQVRGPGTLVPEQVRWITADTAGRVERLPLRPGAPVEPETLLMELSNPDVMLQALDAERQLAQAQADRLTLKLNLEGQAVAERASLAQLRADAADAERRAAANRPLIKDGTISGVDAEQAREKAEALRTRLTLQELRVRQVDGSTGEQLSAQAAQIERLRAVVQFRRRLVDSMKVRAGWHGVLSEMPLELGQWVTPGALLSKVVQPERLKALLRVPETQARDVALGQPVEIDTHNGTILGTVARIAPGASQGAVEVEVRLPEALPKGARPDLTVEGTVQLEKLADVLFVGRPAGAQPDSTVELYKVQPDGEGAARTKVKLGRSSVATIEIREGLAEGDVVVLSDLSTLEGALRIRLR